MIGWFVERFATPQISERLLRHLDETLVRDVRHHWVVFVKPVAVGVVGLFIAACGLFTVAHAAPFCFAIGLLLLTYAGWRALSEHMDRFVLTNMRVFRVTGVFSQTAATMPLNRVLDITVRKTFPGRLLGYGHFVFESAAQDQGLKEISFVPRPDRLDLLIQEQVQRAGLRGKAASERA